jgi:hypothetical protein
MRELLHSEDRTPSGVRTGLDDGDPEHVFFHDPEGAEKVIRVAMARRKEQNYSSMDT